MLTVTSFINSAMQLHTVAVVSLSCFTGVESGGGVLTNNLAFLQALAKSSVSVIVFGDSKSVATE